MKRLIYLFIMLMVLSGCATLGGKWAIEDAISKYQKEALRIQLGDTKEKVFSILLPTQEALRAEQRKSSEAFMDRNDIIEVYYFRSGWQPDGLTTDDEFTPYIFKNGILTGVGWATLGGPKSRGQIRY